MKYIHLLLSIPHLKLKVNRKFNVNFNLNMKYDRVGGKQKTLNFNIQTPLITYHFSSTSAPPSNLSSCLPSPSLFFLSNSLLLELKKLERKVGDNMHHKHVVSEIQNENGFLTENIENFTINLCGFYSTVINKLTRSYKQLGLRLVSKNWKTM